MATKIKKELCIGLVTQPGDKFLNKSPPRNSKWAVKIMKNSDTVQANQMEI